MTMCSLLEEYGNLPGFDSLNASGFFDVTPEEFFDVAPTITKSDKIGPEDRFAFEQQQAKRDKKSEESNGAAKGKDSGLKRRRSSSSSNKRRRSLDRKSRSQSVNQKVEELLVERQEQAQATELPKNSPRKQDDLSEKEKLLSSSSRRVRVGGDSKKDKTPKTPRSSKRRSSLSSPSAHIFQDSKTETKKEEATKITEPDTKTPRSSEDWTEVVLAGFGASTRKERSSLSTSSAQICPDSKTEAKNKEPTKITALDTTTHQPPRIKKRLSKKSHSARNLLSDDTNKSKERKERRRRSSKTSSEAKSKSIDSMAVSEYTGRQRLNKRYSSSRDQKTNTDTLSSTVHSAIPDQTTEIRSLSISETGPNRLRLTVKYSSARNLIAAEEDEKPTPKLRRSKTTTSAATEGARTRRSSLKHSSAATEGARTRRSSSKPKRKSSKGSGRMSVSEGGATRTRLVGGRDGDEPLKAPRMEAETPRTRKKRLVKKSPRRASSLDETLPPLERLGGKNLPLRAASLDDTVPPLAPIEESSAPKQQSMEPETPKTRKARLSKKRTSLTRALPIDEAVPPLQESKEKKDPETPRKRKGRATKKQPPPARSLSVDECSRRRDSTHKKSFSMCDLFTEGDDALDGKGSRRLSGSSRSKGSRRGRSSSASRRSGSCRRSFSMCDLFTEGDDALDGKGSRRLSGSSRSKGSRRGRSSSASRRSSSCRRSGSYRRSGSNKSLLTLEQKLASSKMGTKLTSSNTVSEGMIKSKENKTGENTTGSSTRSEPERTRRRNSLGSGGAQLGEGRTHAINDALESETPRTRRKRLASTTMALPSLKNFLDSFSKLERKAGPPETSRHSGTSFTLDDTIANSEGVSLASTIANSCGVSLASTIANSCGVSLASTIANSTGGSVADTTDREESTSAGLSICTEVSRISDGGRRRRRHSGGHGGGHDALVNTLQKYENPFAQENNAVWIHRKLRASDDDELSDDGLPNSTSASTLFAATFKVRRTLGKR